MVKWSHATNLIHYISTCRRPTNTKLGKVLTYNDRLSFLKPHEFLITWPISGHLIIWKNYIYAITKLMVNKIGRVLTYGRKFTTHTLKLSPTSCFKIFNLLSSYEDNLVNCWDFEQLYFFVFYCLRLSLALN